jgi:glycosyltransferase involved in cell wall biosynthesis
LERQVVKSCSRVVSISESIAGSLKERHPDVSSKKFAVLPNSFDPADLMGLERSRPVPRKVLISHAGTFYGNRSPKPFLEALMKLLEQRPDWKDYIEVLLIGSGPQNGEGLVSFNALKGVVRIIPYLPYKEMLKLLTRSSALLLIPGPGKGTMTGKVFDYIAVRKPILLLSQENTELEKMLRRMGIGLIVPFNEIEEIIERLATIIQACIEGGGIEVEADEEEIGRFTSLEMTRKLAGIMDEVQRDEWG